MYIHQRIRSSRDNSQYAHLPGTYQALVEAAKRNYPGFWARLAREQLVWHKPFTKVLDASNAPFCTWFEDGRINASYHCIDRHLAQGRADKTANIFEADDGIVTQVTYCALSRRVFANALSAEVARHQKGRPRGDLYADINRSDCRHTSVCTDRRNAFGGL